jgi:hypothetical protein
MVFFTLSKKVTGLIGPFLLRTGLAARNALSRTTTRTPRVDAPYLDMLCLVPIAQKLISLAVYDESLKVVSSYHNDKSSRVGQALDSIRRMMPCLGNPNKTPKRKRLAFRN